MYGYDPIFLEKRKIDEWLSESEDNIVVMFDKQHLQFSASPTSSDSIKQYKIFCLKKQFLFNPEIKDIFVKCTLENGQILVKTTYSSKGLYNNIGFYINKNVVLDVKSLKPSLHNERFFKVSINTEGAVGDNTFISKETLALSNIGLFKLKKLNSTDKKINKKNIPYKEDVYFESLLSKALYDYSYKWDGPINSYLRFGDVYFYTSIFDQTFKVYGDTKKSAAEAIKNKIIDLDRAFLEAAPRHERPYRTYYRGMKTPFDNLINVGDSTIVPNFISITDNYSVALDFSDIKKTNCCFYEIRIDNGIPHINMINTTKFKKETETLLPRNLKFTITDKTVIGGRNMSKIKIAVSLQNNDQFKIYSGCSKFYVGKLTPAKSTYLDIVAKSKNDVITSENKKATKSKRCPNGTRKNKITGLCESITKTADTNNSNENITSKQKTKSKRCPNGTRRNKITGLCEAK